MILCYILNFRKVKSHNVTAEKTYICIHSGSVSATVFEPCSFKEHTKVNDTKKAIVKHREIFFDAANFSVVP
jgi:hypothetical protein